MTEMTHEDCYVSCDDTSICVGNSLIERRWDLRHGVLYTASILNKATNTQWCVRPADQGGQVLAPQTGAAPSLDIGVKKLRCPLQQLDSLLVRVRLTHGEQIQVTCITVTPHQHAIRVQIGLEGNVSWDEPTSLPDGSKPTGVEISDQSKQKHDHGDWLDAIELPTGHVKARFVELLDQTDIHNSLTFEREYIFHRNERATPLRGNLLFIEDTLTGEGFILVKECALPDVRPVEPRHGDFILGGGHHGANDQGASFRIGLRGCGLSGPGKGYHTTLIPYTGYRAGATLALQQYQRDVRPYEADRDGLILSNTWGDRSQDGAIEHDFIEREIDAAAELGIEVVQIDDGWQNGMTSNSVGAKGGGGRWENYYADGNDFWEVNRDRLTKGLEPLIQRAALHDMQFGLWFSPDSSNDFANWDKDAACLLNLYTKYGVRYFKLDGIKARTTQGTENLEAFFNKLLRESNGEIVCDLDVTAEVRPGYFGALAIGPLFIENRYSDWHGYWPHTTLRNTWDLSHVIDPVRLRMEFLNPDRNTHLYTNDPLAPNTYPMDYLFATVMIGSPLAWMEVQNLSSSHRSAVNKLTSVWKAHRLAFQTGKILPIGDRPDGGSWTGFISLNDKAMYVLLFRECSPTDTSCIPLPRGIDWPHQETDMECLAGEGTVQYSPHGLYGELPQQRYFFGVLDRLARSKVNSQENT